MKIFEALTQASLLLEQHCVPNPRLDADILLSSTLRKGRAFLIAHSQDDLEDNILSLFLCDIEKRCQGMPIQYILGRQEFRGLKYEVTPDVLIPRPETEFLVDEALNCLRSTTKPTVVDVGTGSGCIAISLALERPDARVFATDLSQPALEVARRNAQRLGVVNRIQLLSGDLLRPLQSVLPLENVDCICSNPPYVAERDLPTLQREVRDWEPRLALAAGEQGTTLIKQLIPQSWSFLKPGGHLVMEIGFNMQNQMRSLFNDGWQSYSLQGDFNGIPRIVIARKTESS